MRDYKKDYKSVRFLAIYQSKNACTRTSVKIVSSVKTLCYALFSGTSLKMSQSKVQFT